MDSNVLEVVFEAIYPALTIFFFGWCAWRVANALEAIANALDFKVTISKLVIKDDEESADEPEQDR